MPIEQHPITNVGTPAHNRSRRRVNGRPVDQMSVLGNADYGTVRRGTNRAETTRDFADDALALVALIALFDALSLPAFFPVPNLSLVNRPTPRSQEQIRHET